MSSRSPEHLAFKLEQLLELVDRVDRDQVTAVWIDPDRDAAQQLVRALDDAFVDRLERQHRVRVTGGHEGYRHRAGGRIRIVTPLQSLRGLTVDEIHDHSADARWPVWFAADILVLRLAGAEMRGRDAEE